MLRKKPLFPTSFWAFRARMLRYARQVFVFLIATWIGMHSGAWDVSAQPPPPKPELEDLVEKERYTFLGQAAFFGTWPESCFQKTKNEFVLVILGRQKDTEVLDKLVLRMPAINGRRIAIKRVADLEKISPCQILFITKDVPPEIQRKAIHLFRGKPVLVVGESADFAKSGGCVGLIEKDGTIVKEFNTAEIKAQSVVVDLRLQRDSQFVETIPENPAPPTQKPMREDELPPPELDKGNPPAISALTLPRRA